jgi:alpha-galactosidase
MSLWSLAPSPLMLGANLPDNDEWTLSLLTNDEVIAVNQDPMGNSARRMVQTNNGEIWVKELKNGDKAIGLFNRGSVAQDITLDWESTGLAGQQTLRDVWSHKNLGRFNAKYSTQVPAHGAVLLRAARYSSQTQARGAALLRATQPVSQCQSSLFALLCKMVTVLRS